VCSPCEIAPTSAAAIASPAAIPAWTALPVAAVRLPSSSESCAARRNSSALAKYARASARDAGLVLLVDLGMSDSREIGEWRADKGHPVSDDLRPRSRPSAKQRRELRFADDDRADGVAPDLSSRGLPGAKRVDPPGIIGSHAFRADGQDIEVALGAGLTAREGPEYDERGRRRGYQLCSPAKPLDDAVPDVAQRRNQSSGLVCPVESDERRGTRLAARDDTETKKVTDKHRRLLCARSRESSDGSDCHLALASREHAEDAPLYTRDHRLDRLQVVHED